MPLGLPLTLGLTLLSVYSVVAGSTNSPLTVNSSFMMLLYISSHLRAVHESAWVGRQRVRRCQCVCVRKHQGAGARTKHSPGKGGGNLNEADMLGWRGKQDARPPCWAHVVGMRADWKHAQLATCEACMRAY